MFQRNDIDPHYFHALERKSVCSFRVMTNHVGGGGDDGATRYTSLSFSSLNVHGLHSGEKRSFMKKHSKLSLVTSKIQYLTNILRFFFFFFINIFFVSKIKKDTLTVM